MRAVLLLRFDAEGECWRASIGHISIYSVRDRKNLIPNQPRATYEAYVTMFSSISGGWAHWVPKKSCLIRRTTYKPSDQTSALSGLRRLNRPNALWTRPFGQKLTTVAPKVNHLSILE